MRRSAWLKKSEPPMSSSKKKLKSPDLQTMDADLASSENRYEMLDEEITHSSNTAQHDLHHEESQKILHSEVDKNNELPDVESEDDESSNSDTQPDEFYDIPLFPGSLKNASFCNDFSKTLIRLKEMNKGVNRTTDTHRFYMQMMYRQTEFLAQQNSVLNNKLNVLINSNEKSEQALSVSMEQNMLLIDKIEKLEQRIQILETNNNKNQQNLVQIHDQQEQIIFRTSSLQDTAATIKFLQRQQQKSFASVAKNSTKTNFGDSPSFARIIPTSTAPANATKNRTTHATLSFQTQHSNSTSTQNSTSTPPDTHAQNFTLASTPESLYSLQFQTKQTFKSTGHFINLHLRRIQTQNRLPDFHTISLLKNSTCDFRLRFYSVLHRQQWFDCLSLRTDIFQSIQLVNLSKTKIAIQGIPTQLLQAKSPIDIAKSCFKHIEIPSDDMIHLFTMDEKLSPGFHSIVLLISPATRRIIHSKNYAHFIPELDIAIKFSDFHQPLQCSKCDQLGHAAKKCNNSNAPSCDQHQHLHCINCQSTDHNAKNRNSCPAYQYHLFRSIDNLEKILNEHPKLQATSNSSSESQQDALPHHTTPITPSQSESTQISDLNCSTTNAPTTITFESDPTQQLSAQFSEQKQPNNSAEPISKSPPSTDAT
jgi:hypothetical protein